MISFNLPQASYLLLLLLPILAGQLFLVHVRRNRQREYTTRETLSRLQMPRSPTLTATKAGGWLIIWALACTAYMEPYGNIHYLSPTTTAEIQRDTPKPRFAPHEVIFLVDTSASMRVPDGGDENSRLEAAKIIMEDIMRQLNGQIVSLYAFTSELTAVVPPTLDYLFLRLSIHELHIDQGDVGGTLFAPVLKALQESAFPQPTSQRYSIVMLSDGGDNQLETLSGVAREQAVSSILTAMTDAKENHVRLFTIGMGSLKPSVIPGVTDHGKSVSSKLEPDILKELAAAERGKYYMSSEWTSWDLAQDLKKEFREDRLIATKEPFEKGAARFTRPEEAIVDWYFQIPLGIALLFYLINLLLPDVRRV